MKNFGLRSSSEFWLSMTERKPMSSVFGYWEQNVHYPIIIHSLHVKGGLITESIFIFVLSSKRCTSLFQYFFTVISRLYLKPVQKLKLRIMHLCYWPFDLGTCIRSESSCPLAVIKVTAIGLVEVVAEAVAEAVYSISFVEFSVQLVFY